MEKNKTFYTFAQKNSIDLLYDDTDMMIVSIDLMHEDDKGECNRNKCNISHATIEKSKGTIPNKPILFRYDSTVKELVTDVTEHARDDEELFNTRIAGHIPTDSRITFVERDNGKTYINCEAVIQKRYVPQLVNILKAHKGNLKVSTEIIAKGEQDEDSGIFIIDEFKLQGVMLLSDTVEEGIENSQLMVLKFSKNEISTMNKVYMTFASKGMDIFEKIKIEKEIKNMALGVHELERRLWDVLKTHLYHDGSWAGKKYWIYEILADSKEVIVHDNETDEYYKMPYKVSKDGDVTVDTEKRVKVIEDKSYREIQNAFIFAKEEYGKGEKIEIDDDKDAISDTPWGEVNKTDLRNKVLDAENYKELVDAVYLRVEDGWEDAPSEKLSYPVMEIKGGKAVYNRDALASALGYAKANNESDVLEKIEDIYDELDLDNDDDKDKNIETAQDEEPEADKIQNAIVEWEKKFNDEHAECECYKAKCDELENKCGELENKYAELEKKFYEIEEKYRTYKAIEDKNAMYNELEKYKKAFSESEYEIMASDIESGTKDEYKDIENFKAYLDNKLTEKAKSMFATDKGEEGFSSKYFSNSMKGNMMNYGNDISRKKSGIDAVLANLGCED